MKRWGFFGEDLGLADDAPRATPTVLGLIDKLAEGPGGVWCFAAFAAGGLASGRVVGEDDALEGFERALRAVAVRGAQLGAERDVADMSGHKENLTNTTRLF